MRLTASILWIASVSIATTAFAATPVDLLRAVPLRFEPVDGPQYQWVARGAAYAVAFGSRDTLIAAGDRGAPMTPEGSQAASRCQASRAASRQHFLDRSPHAAPAHSPLL